MGRSDDDVGPSPESSERAPRILFVSHEATRTGAPIMFLHFLRWLRRNTDLDFEILLLAGGPLTDEFAAVAPLTHIEALGASTRSYLEAGLARAGLPDLGDRLKISRSRRAVEHLRGFDALYLNSTTSAIALRILPEIPPMVLSHVHELDSAFRYWFPANHRSAMLRHTDHYITCAEVVSQHLVGEWRVPAEKISCHHEFIEPPGVEAGAASRTRHELGIPPHASVVGGSGMVCWRKGTDLFVEVAATIRRRRPDLEVHFIWLGGNSTEKMPIEIDVDRLGLSNRIHMVGESDRPHDTFAAFDAFALTSREDPYPLVMLESAALGVPVVSFANGGSVEFAGSDDPPAALIVDYLDVGAMADSLIGLLEDDPARHELGERGRRRVLEHHSIDVAAPALHRELRDLVGEPTRIDLTGTGSDRGGAGEGPDGDPISDGAPTMWPGAPGPDAIQPDAPSSRPRPMTAGPGQGSGLVAAPPIEVEAAMATAGESEP